MDLTPELVLATWAGGLAAGAAVVAAWRVVGPGYLWLAGGVTVLFGAGALWAEPSPPAIVATGALAAAIALARRPPAAVAAFALAAAGYFVAALPGSGVAATLTGMAALGGVTAEMVLGHWYLVDPTLPRWALQRLDLAAAAGMAADVAVLALRGAWDWPAGDAVIGWAFVVLAAFSLLLLAAVWFALREPSYSGVMAATGLSYLAVLTVFGSTVLGRALLDPAAL